jgi:hypothetical protein
MPLISAQTLKVRALSTRCSAAGDEISTKLEEVVDLIVGGQETPGLGRVI